MVKRFTPIKFKEIENEQVKDVILQFRLGPRATHLYKAISGKSFDSIGKNGFDIEEIVHILYAGCHDMKKDLTIEKMWELVDNFELDDLGNLMNEIFPQPAGEQVPNVEA